jgi:hypothetical protein
LNPSWQSPIGRGDDPKNHGVDEHNSMVEERQQNDDRDRHAEKPKQYSAAHGFSPVGKVPVKQATAEFVPSYSIAEKFSSPARCSRT